MMGLSCSCPDFDGESWWYEYNSNSLDFAPFVGKRRTRCCSCLGLIDIGADCLTLQRFRAPITDIEASISGDEVQISDLHLCSKCGEIFLNLDALGYCMTLSTPRSRAQGFGESMQDMLEEYHDLIGWEPGMGPGPNCQELSTPAPKIVEE